MPTSPLPVRQVPIIVPEGFDPPWAAIGLPAGSAVTAVGITLDALLVLTAAAEVSADERLRAGVQLEENQRIDLVRMMARVALGRLLWLHLDPAASGPFFDHPGECVRGKPSGVAATTYLYLGRFLFSVEVTDGVVFLDSPAESCATG